MSSSAAERAVARVLLWGGLVSVVLMLIGLGAYVVQGAPHARDDVRILQNRRAGRAVGTFTSLTDVREALRRRPPDPLAFATIGLICLLATPTAGVAVAMVYFWRQHDWPYTLITAVLLAMLLVDLVFVGGG